MADDPHRDFGEVAYDIGEGRAYEFLDTLTFVRWTGEETAGRFSMVEQRLREGHGPPLHVHAEDDEMFHVLEGRATFKVGDEEVEAVPGRTVFLPHGVPHTFLAEERTAMLAWSFPAGLEEFLREVGEPTDDPSLPTEPANEEEVEHVRQVAAKYDFEVLGPPLGAEG